MPTIEQQLRQFVIDNFAFGLEGDALRNDDSLLDQGIVDSTGVLELVAFLEERFGIKVQDQELVASNLDSINGLVGFLERKIQAAQGQPALEGR
jgi:acyl carrier protein